MAYLLVAFLCTLVLAAPNVVALAAPALVADTWFPGPFNTDGRWMINAKGDRLTMAGVNWPGSADTMVPEGLQYASIPDIITKIKSIGMNAWV